MATLSEKPESRRHNADGSVTLVYDYRSAGSDAATAYAALLTSLPATFGDLVRETHAEMEPVWVDSVNNDGDYLVHCRYLPVEKSRQAAEEVTVRISTAAGTRRITQAYAHIADYPTGSSPSHKGALNVTKDGPQGADVVDPTVMLTVIRRYAVASLPSSSSIIAIRGKVNSDETTIKDTRKNRTYVFAAGELLCHAAEEGLVADDGMVDVVYQFEGSPNQTGLTVGDLTGIAKKGHEHLWTEYFDSVDAGGRKISTPLYAHVDQIYPTAAMNGLGLNPSDE